MKGIVWGYTFEDGKEKLRAIEDAYHYMNISCIERRENKNEFSIVFSNGD